MMVQALRLVLLWHQSPVHQPSCMIQVPSGMIQVVQNTIASGTQKVITAKLTEMLMNTVGTLQKRLVVHVVEAQPEGLALALDSMKNQLNMLK
jgi:hypothetical protein